VEIACALFEEVPSTTSPSESPQSVASDQASAWWFRTPMVGMLLRVFSASWGLPEPQIGLLGGMKEQCADGGAPPSPSASASAPFVFMADPEAVEKARRNQRLAALLIDQSGGPLAASPHSQTVLQEHQMREHTLDALILLLRNPLGLESLVPCSPSPIGAPGIKGGVLVGVFRLLQGLVLALLQREAPAHVRAALASVVLDLAPSLGRDRTIKDLLPHFLLLLRDDFHEVVHHAICAFDPLLILLL